MLKCLAVCLLWTCRGFVVVLVAFADRRLATRDNDIHHKAYIFTQLAFVFGAYFGMAVSENLMDSPALKYLT